jgi:hypothetical protein
MKFLRSALPGIAVDLAGLIGVGLIGYGVWQIYPPATYIVVGAVFVVGAIAFARGE